MSMLRRLVGANLVSDAVVLQLVQWLCFAAAPVLLIISIRAVVRFAATSGEILSGVLAASTVSLLLVVLGLVVPLSRQGDA